MQRPNDSAKPTRKFTLRTALTLSLVLVAPVALAQDAESSSALRDKARTALAAGQTAEACVLFEQSHKAAQREQTAGTAGAPAPDEVLFELAQCHEKQGKGAVAQAEYEQVAAGQSGQAAAAATKVKELKKPPQPPQPAGADPMQQAAQPEGHVAAGSPAQTSLDPSAATNPDPTKSSGAARIGDFMDTRLTWVIGDDDFLHATGEALPLSPNLSIGDRRQYRLFFDNLNSRFGGRENLTHLALYAKMPGYVKNLDTEASLVVRFDLGALARNTNNLNQALYDAGSFIRAFYHTDGKSAGKQGLGITLFPIDTDRMRLGYLYDISWGGTAASINQSIFPRIQGSSPGAKVQYDHEKFSVYGGIKTASIVQVESVLTPGTSEVEQIRVGQTNYGFLGGAGADLGEYLHADVGAGYFTQGKFDLPDVEGQAIYTYGVSGRLVAHDAGSPPPQSVDFQLYRNDPNKPMVIFKPEKYEAGKTSYAVSVEGSYLSQALKDFDAAGVVTTQPAIAGALQGNIKSGFFRASLTGIYRDLPFVLRNQPSFIPFQTLPDNAGTTNELFFAAAGDYHFEGPKLTPGIGAGLQVPATFNTSSIDDASAPINRTVVVREQGNIAILPVNKSAVPIFQMRASLKWDVSRILSTLIWVQYARDNNGTFVERDPNEGTVALRTFIRPDFVGAGMSAQARF